jgi:UDP-N-acetylmuramyl pentapeptide phosphotransferase/UDP-N-acetylglucosamine-1-phosphate transferase
MMLIPEPLLSLFSLLAAAVLSAAIIWVIRPLMVRHAMAQPNARSSHRTPTPQGAGIAVIAATLLVAGLIVTGAGLTGLKIPIAVFAASLFIAIVGFADDVKSIAVLPRLLLQGAAVAAIVFTASSELRIVPGCPLWIERTLLLFAGLWFVNLVNFMDGLDWMTVAEAVPITATMVILGALSEFPTAPTLVSAALCGAMLGFAPFNRPVARIFLGDVGSLPIGLLLGWCLLQLGYEKQYTAALLLPMYYLFDATATLLRRMARREPFWSAHRSHFYQRATENGFTVWRVVGDVFALNLVLAAFAIGSILTQSVFVEIVLLTAGCIATVFVMYRFAQPRSR